MIVLAALWFSHQGSAEDHKLVCDRQFYRAADSRLDPRIVGLLPKHNEPVVGFEIIQDRPMVALTHQLVGFEEKGLAEFAVPQALKGLSYGKELGVLLQTETGFLRIGNQGLEPVTRMNSVVNGRIYGSGSPVFVEVRARKGVLQFIARRNNGTAFPIAALKGPLRAASWNEFGLATVVGDSLYLWQPGAKSVVRVLTDRGLASARDVVAVGNSRAVVALKATVVLVSPETFSIVATLPLARCRFHNGFLYVLQESAGLIWAIRGLEKLGSRQADQTFARDLLKQAASQPTKNSAQFFEAARILGCKEAEAESNLPTSNPSSK
jgi:hypothetical protein